MGVARFKGPAGQLEDDEGKDSRAQIVRENQFLLGSSLISIRYKTSEPSLQISQRIPLKGRRGSIRGRILGLMSGL